MVIAGWDHRYTEPIYLVSNLTCVKAACQMYRKRMRIETFFSDQKSRGFQVDKSHLSDAERVSHLMIAACFAYLWVIYLGNVAHADNWLSSIHRQHRCDLSRFQIGLRLLDYLLNHDEPIPIKFIFESDESESVR
jgi:Transposase DDE domain